MRYPIGTQTFSNIIERNMLYVDKTALVYELAQKSICFLCRPRRFGKSLLLSTLKSYFKGERELFRGLQMERLEKDWMAYPVFHIDFAQGGYGEKDGLKEELDHLLNGWERQLGIEKSISKPGTRFSDVLAASYRQTGRKAVVLIDEYDRPLLDVLMRPAEEENRETLKEFYGTFKAADEYLRFVLLTGVTKFSQVSVFSGFNQPEDISMNRRFDALCGITEEELHRYFDGEMRSMAEECGISAAEMYACFKKRYDGYHFSEQMTDIYNPFSVMNALSNRRLDDYWFASGTPSYLLRLIDRNKVNVQEMLERTYAKKYFIDYKADEEDPLAMIYQSGYLTIRGYDARRNEFKLDMPNAEVKNGFVDLLARSYFKETDGPDSRIMDFADMLEDGRLDDLKDALTAFFAEIPYDANWQERAWSYESHYHYTLYLIFRLLSCHTVLTEKQNSRGRADIVVETEKYVYIFEFKLNGTSDEALRQIKEKGYAEPYASDGRKLFSIGVNFSSEKKNIAEWKAEVSAF